MNTGSSISMTTMKPCCRILSCCKNSSIFGISSHLITINYSPRLRYRLDCNRNRYDCFTPKNVGYRFKHDPNRKDFYDSGFNRGRRDRVIRRDCGNCSGRFRRVLVMSNEARNNSTSASSLSPVDAHNETSYDSLFIQGGLNVNVLPLVLEGIKNEVGLALDEQENKVGVNEDGTEELNGEIGDVKVESSKKKLSKIEEEALKLLRSTVVNYCGNPVGTVAANDPADTLPLNYDQVFIRDFVPSALAFLLNGEGDIVKNFLLHTLQLQVTELYCFNVGF